MTSQPGKQTITGYILPDFPCGKSNETMKFRHLIEYNMRDTFLEKSYTKCGAETIPRPFSEKSRSGISLDQ